MIEAAPLYEAPAPYPGLRPFRADESDFFFGREEHIDELLMKLESNRFVAVVGASGCGKSSLVRAGLIPMLKHGFIAEAGPNWRVATMRPGNAPFEHLALALLDEEALGKERGHDPQSAGMLEATLRRGRLGLVEAMQETLLPAGTNLLVLVDQFEEIFRYRQQSSVDEAEAFVDLILAAAQHRRRPDERHPSAPVYVLITMRSDFFGDCALFMGLPEAINDSQFLTPRLTRDQCRAAVVGPARALGGDVEPALVNHLLNNLRADADHLPLLQHSLMRMWRTAVEKCQDDTLPALSLADLEATGGIENALSIHADEAFHELQTPQQRIAEIMFRSLCETGEHGRATRRLVKLSEIAASAGVKTEHVRPVVEVFRHPDRSFLMPPVGTPLEADTIVDISHESLIRQWHRLTDWAAKEDKSADTYRRLFQTAELWKAGQAGLWRNPDLEIAEEWNHSERPNAAWAERYGGDFEETMSFLDTSIEAREAHHRRRRKLRVAAFAALLLVAAATAIAAFIAKKAEAAAVAAKEKAVAQEQLAYAAREEAELEKEKAEAQEKLASMAAYNANFNGILEDWQSQLDTDEVSERLNNEERFPPEFQDFAWRFCQSLTQRSLPTQLIGHEGSVACVAYAKDRNLMATASEDQTVRIWTSDAKGHWRTIENGEIPQEQDVVLCVAVAPDGSAVAWGCEEGSVKLWEVESRRLRCCEGQHAARIRSLAFSPDGKSLASGSDDYTIKIWDVDAGRLRQTIEGHTNWIASVAYSRDGKTLASASHDTTVRLWDMASGGEQTGLLIDTQNPCVVHSVAIGPAGKTVAAACEDGTIKLWDLATHVNWKTLTDGHRSAIHAVAFSADGETLASADREGLVILRDTTTYRMRTVPQKRHEGLINWLAFLPNGRQLASAGSDKTVRLWDSQIGLRMDLDADEIPLGDASRVAYAPASARCATAHPDGTIRLWNIGKEGTPPLIGELKAGGERITALCFDPTGKTLYSACPGDTKGTITRWDVATKAGAGVDDAHFSTVQAIAFDTAGQTMATGSEDGTIRLWGVGPDDLRALGEPLSGHTGGIQSLVFGGTGDAASLLASGSEDSTIRLWDLATATQLRVLVDHEDWVLCVAFSQDGKMLASASEDKKIKLWRVPELLSTAGPWEHKKLEAHSQGVTSLAFIRGSTPESATLASASMDKTVRLWDPQLGQLRVTLPGHARAVRSIAFLGESGSSPSALLVSASDDGTLKFWGSAFHIDSSSNFSSR